MKEFNLTDQRKEILAAIGHLLIEGGPGSGKTTISLLKAKKIIDSSVLKPNQKILFLSFARATISRVEDQSKDLFTIEDKRKVEINTYHGFTWSIIQSYGYLLSPHRNFKLITPPNLSAKLANIPPGVRNDFKKSLLFYEGIICFDLFAETVATILEKSHKICSIISDTYPYIIVDEFQDTDSNEWELIKLLGAKSNIIALADLEQRIYDFRGASLERIPEFVEHFEPKQFDLGTENNRSGNTDILEFGNDLLLGSNIGKTYKDVKISKRGRSFDPKSFIRYAILDSIKRLKTTNGNKDWSIAVLVKSKQETLDVSAYLSKQSKTVAPIFHEVLIDPAGPALAASVIAQVLEPISNEEEDSRKLLLQIINHIKGRKNDKPSQNDLKLAEALDKYLIKNKITGSNRILLIDEIKSLVKLRSQINFTGVPHIDWVEILKLFGNSNHDVLKNIYEDSQYIKLLKKGTILNEKLSEIWKTKGQYYNAGKAVEESLTIEHFSMTQRKWNGIFVMTIHKSKGKEFNEVIIWDDEYRPIVSSRADEERIKKDRILLRVAFTRAMSKATFLTPSYKSCILI